MLKSHAPPNRHFCDFLAKKAKFQHFVLLTLAPILRVFRLQVESQVEVRYSQQKVTDLSHFFHFLANSSGVTQVNSMCHAHCVSRKRFKMTRTY